MAYPADEPGATRRRSKLLLFLHGVGGFVVLSLLLPVAGTDGLPVLFGGVAVILAAIVSARWRAFAVGYILGAVAVYVLVMVVWANNSGCADELPDGRVIEVECG